MGAHILTVRGFAWPTFDYHGVGAGRGHLEAPGSYWVSAEKWRLGRKSGLEKEISSLNCLPWRQFAELALPCLSQCLWKSTQWKLVGVDGLGSNYLRARTLRSEMISPAHLKWTKTATRWTPAPFCWFWLFRSTPMALRGQQVRYTFISIS